ncbi:MAG: hypothetical protein ABH873_03250 [Candidatus Firestonebacteria bacterium]
MLNKIVIKSNRWIAIVLSIFLPGLGHYYLFRKRNGIALILCYILIEFYAYYCWFSNIVLDYLWLYSGSFIHFIFVVFVCLNIYIITEKNNENKITLSIFLSTLLPGLGNLYLKWFIYGTIIFLVNIIVIYLFYSYIISEILFIVLFYLCMIISIYYIIKNNNLNIIIEKQTKILLLIAIVYQLLHLFFINNAVLIKDTFQDNINNGYKITVINNNYYDLRIGDIIQFNMHNVNKGDEIVYYKEEIKEYVIRKCIAISGDKINIKEITSGIIPENTYLLSGYYKYVYIGVKSTIFRPTNEDNNSFEIINRKNIIGKVMKYINIPKYMYSFYNLNELKTMETYQENNEKLYKDIEKKKEILNDLENESLKKKEKLEVLKKKLNELQKNK